MFNFHVGIPGIAPDLLHSVVQAGLLGKCEATTVLSQELWRAQFRGLVNSKKNGSDFAETAWRKAESTISHLSTHNTVAVSQHALLGTPQDCFFTRSVLPFAHSRVVQISKLFATVPLTLHLTISSQFDYFCTIMDRLPDGDALPLPGSVPSWAELVARIRTAAPNRQIVVWDFESPEKVVLAFLICLLNTEDWALIEALAAHMSPTMKTPNSPNIPENHRIPPDLISQMDVQYELDLEAIKHLEGVSLVLPQSIPEELYLGS